ncbi:MAG: hypothetical protein ABR543_16395 [Gemmatimonadaceae bacterium]
MLKSRQIPSAFRPPCSLQRCGFTIIETVAGLTVLGLVTVTLTQVLTSEQRFFYDTSEIIRTRGTVRQVAGLLGTELRGLSPANGDIYSPGKTFIEYRGGIGTSVVCTGAGTGTITLPPLVLASRSGLTSFSDTPMAGDSLWIHDQGLSPDTADDRWNLHAMVSNPGPGTCPQSSGFTVTAAEAANGLTLVVTPPLSPTTVDGASIRIFRRARLELFQAADTKWYLGYFDCSPARIMPCSIIQPVSGPYLSPAAGGLDLAYFDRSGTPTLNPLLIARIHVMVRGETGSMIRSSGNRPMKYRDSLASVFAVRNR